MLALGAGLAGVVVTATAAYATLPGGTTVTASLKPGTNITFVGKINSVPITVTCTSFSASGQTPSPPSDTVTLANPPQITGCTDSTGGGDTIVTNQKNGSWVLTGKGKKAPYKLTLLVPKAGATFTSNIIPGCVITAAPSKPGKVTGSYDGNNTDR
jgi:hypothetical protein